MGGLTVTQRGGVTKTVNEFLQKETGGLALRDPSTFLDESTKFINRLLEADVIAGHNIFFDIGSLTSTMKQMQGFDSHTEAKTAVGKLLSAISEDGRVVDTLEFTRTYLNDQVNQMLETLPVGTDDFTRMEKFRELIYSPEFLSRIRAGGSAPYASMEAISLNTNLLNLLYKDAESGDTFAREVFEGIFKGTHIADTDAALQTYMAKYMITDDPSGGGKMLRVTERGTSYNEHVIAAQKAVARSSATTITTNISDVQNISDDMLDFILRDEKSKKMVSLSLEKGVLDPLKAGNLAYGTIEEGVIPGVTGKYTGYYFATSEGVQQVDQAMAEGIISDTLRGAAAGPTSTSTLSWGATREVNKFADRISSLGINILQAHQINEMSRMAGAITPGAAMDITKESLLDNIGSTYKMFGSGLNIMDMVNVARGRTPTHAGFTVGLNNYGLGADATAEDIFGVATEYAASSQAMGNVYSNLDVRSRVFSSVMAESTSHRAGGARNIIRQRLVAAEEAGDAALVSKYEAQLESLKYADVADVLPEYGVSHYAGQKDIRILQGLGDEVRTTNRLFLPVDMVNQVASDVLAAEGGMKAGRMSMSVAKQADGSEKINLFWKMNSDLSRDQKRSFMGRIVDDIMAKHEALSGDERLMEEHERLVKTAATIESAGKDSVVEMLLDAEEQGGIGIAYDDTNASRTTRNLARQGYDATNDALVRDMTAEFIDELGEGDIVRVGAFADEETLRRSGTVRASGEEAVESLNRAATVIAEEGIESEVRTRFARSRLGLGANKILDFYIGNKKNIRNVGLGLIAAGVGYYTYGKYKENKMYDETLESQPVEYGGRRFESPRLTQSDLSSFRRDPLVTAGVVGNLDRNKIGHTRMGPDKYNHLYGA